jgi:hypothetical protein
MASVDTQEVWAIVAGVTLASSVPLGELVVRLSQGRQRATESFAAGASLAYVIIELMVELTSAGGAHVHAVAPIGATEEQSLFSVVLAGATAWYVIAATLARLGGRLGPYRSRALPRAIYGVFVGGAVAFEAEHGGRALMLFVIALLLHLTIVEAHEHRELAAEHTGWIRILVGFAPALGAAVWALLDLPRETLYWVLALVAGSTFVQIVQAELPSPALLRVVPFLVGVAVYSVLVVARWAL